MTKINLCSIKSKAAETPHTECGHAPATNLASGVTGAIRNYRGAPKADARNILTLQKTLGNRAVQKVLSTVVARDDADAGVTSDAPSDAGAPAPELIPSPGRNFVQDVIELLSRRQPVAGTGDFQAAFRYLNGLSLADLVNTLVELYRRHHLESLQEHFGEAVGVNRARLEAAIASAPLVGQNTTALAVDRLRAVREMVERLPNELRDEMMNLVPSLRSPTVSVSPGDITPPAGSPFASLPEPLRRTLFRSFQARLLGVAFSGHNMDNSFWGGTPADFWQAVERLQRDGNLNILLQNYTRFVSAGLPWDTIETIHNIWGGSSLGFEYAASDPQRLRQAVIARFCRDAWYADPLGTFHPGKTCYREVISGSQGLHICFAQGGRVHDMHLDHHQTVEGREEDGDCNYDMGATISHWGDLLTK